MPTSAELLEQSLTALRAAKRFSLTVQSYRKDNPAEYAKVIAYLDGGVRPSGVTTEMGNTAARGGSYFDEVMADSPAAYWRMDEASGQPQDSSGNGNNTTTTSGTPTYSQPEHWSPTLPAPRSSSNRHRRTTSRHPDHATLDLGDVFTLEAPDQEGDGRSAWVFVMSKRNWPPTQLVLAERQHFSVS